MDEACSKCGYVTQIGDWPFCKGSPDDHKRVSFNVQDDSIPGGIWIKHGLCNEDGTPKRYDSKSEIRRAEKEKGWTNVVTHVGLPGSDKSPHTRRWY